MSLREITVVVAPGPGVSPETKALRKRMQRLYLDGLDPAAIAARLGCPEALVGTNLREGRNRLSDDYRQMRVARIYALKQQGLTLPEIAEWMGVNKVLLNKDMREMPQKPTSAASRRKNTGNNRNE